MELETTMVPNFVLTVCTARLYSDSGSKGGGATGADQSAISKGFSGCEITNVSKEGRGAQRVLPPSIDGSEQGVRIPVRCGAGRFDLRGTKRSGSCCKEYSSEAEKLCVFNAEVKKITISTQHSIWLQRPPIVSIHWNDRGRFLERIATIFCPQWWLGSVSAMCAAFLRTRRFVWTVRISLVTVCFCPCAPVVDC